MAKSQQNCFGKNCGEDEYCWSLACQISLLSRRTWHDPKWAILDGSSGQWTFPWNLKFQWIYGEFWVPPVPVPGVPVGTSGYQWVSVGTSGYQWVSVGTSGYQCTRYQCTRCTKKTKTKSAVLPTSLMSFYLYPCHPNLSHPFPHPPFLPKNYIHNYTGVPVT